MIWFKTNGLSKYFLAIFFVCSQGFSQEITKGPYLVEPGSQSMIIRWETNMQSSGTIKYGINTNKYMTKNAVLRGEKHGGYLYEVHLDSLEPGYKYWYQVITDSSETPIERFKTFFDSQQMIRFVAMGDSRSNPVIFKKIINSVESENPDLIISMGDIVENGGDIDQWNDYYFSVAKDLISQIPMVSTLGDHEGDGDDGELFRHYLRIDQPTNKQWFSFDYGDAHFISLDYRHPENQEMIEWFKKDISSSDARWNFVYMHRPCYNLGGHRSTWGRDKWPDLFRKYKVDIVFAGHSHIYERFYPIRPQIEQNSWPITYITTGGAGAELYDAKQNSYLAKAESVNHHLYFEIIGDTLTAKVYRIDNSLLDEFSIIKNNEYFDGKYISQVMPQENLDILTMFTGAISTSIESIPLNYYAGKVFVELESPVDYTIPFTVQLSENSAENYQMDVFTGVLDGKENKQIMVKIYSRTNITISQWGEITPELALKVIYKDQSVKKTVEGGMIGFWP